MMSDAIKGAAAPTQLEPAKTIEPAPAVQERVARCAGPAMPAGSGAGLPSPSRAQGPAPHAPADPLHALNEQCYNEVRTIRQLNIDFFNLRANSKAIVAIGDGERAILSEGSGNSNLVGLSLSTNAPALYLRSFLVNAREMIIETFQDCEQLSVALYVRTEQSQLRGRVDLPPGASVTLQSRCDRTSLIGLSSFAVELE